MGEGAVLLQGVGLPTEVGGGNGGRCQKGIALDKIGHSSEQPQQTKVALAKVFGSEPLETRLDAIVIVAFSKDNNGCCRVHVAKDLLNLVVI